MRTVITAPTARRTRCIGLAAAALVVAMLTNPGWLFADVDLTGAWNYDEDAGGFFGDQKLQLTQTGTVLTMRFERSGTYTATIDPATGVFGFSSGLDDEECGGGGLGGTASPDGNSIVGSAGGEVMSAPPFSGCILVTWTFTATRAPCGNGVLDPGETCDTGDPSFPFDCCSPTCQLLVAGRSCRPAAGPCDAEDVCDGVSGICTNTVAPAGTTCRASTGSCDAAEVCTGLGAACPPDDDDVCEGCSEVLAKPKLALASYDGVTGNDKLALGAELALSSAGAAFLDPAVNGVAIVIGTTGGDGSVSMTLPPGLYDAATGRGWKPAKSGRAWAFFSTDPLLAITKATVKLVVGKSGPRAVVKAIGKRRSFAEVVPAQPLAMRVILDSPAPGASSCGEAGFSAAGGPAPSCKVKAKGTALACH